MYMKKIILLMFLSWSFTASAQWFGVSGPPQKNTVTGEFRWNFGSDGLFSPYDLFLKKTDTVSLSNRINLKIQNNLTNTPQNARISVSDSIKTTGVVQSAMVNTDSISFLMPWRVVPGNPLLNAISSIKKSILSPGRLGFYATGGSIIPLAEKASLRNGGGILAISGQYNDGPAFMVADSDYVNHSLGAYYFTASKGKAFLGFLHQNSTYTLQITPINGIRTAIQYDSIGNVGIVQRTGAFTAFGKAAYNEAQPLTALSFAYKQYNDSTYQSLLISGTNIKTVNSNSLLGSGNIAVGDALVANPLSQFAATTSAQLASTLSDETGSGLVVFNNSPTFITPTLGNASANSINLTAVSVGAPTTGSRIFAGTSSNAFGWIGTSGFKATFTSNGITADRQYVVPNIGGTIATIDGSQVFTSATWNATKIGEIYGGTNQSTYTTGDMLYASASNTLSKLGIGSTNAILTVIGGIPSWTNSPNFTNLSAQNFYTTSAAPTVTLLSTATSGTGATISITGTNNSGTISLTTGSGVSSTGDIFRVTNSGGFAFPRTSIPVLQLVRSASINPNITIDNLTGTAWDVNTGATQLASSTNYVWTYVNIGN